MELIILGHIIGDFYVQTGKIAQKKIKAIKYMLLHCVIYSMIIGLCFYLLNRTILGTLVISSIILVTHFAIDMIKRECDKKHANKEYLFFIVDQAVHIIILFCMFYFGNSYFENKRSVYPMIHEINIRPYIMSACACLVCWKPAAIFVPLVFNAIPKTVAQADEIVPNEAYIEKEGVKIGSWIGILEREIMLMLGLMGQYGAIGFVLTAKSLARYKQLENKSFAEKYLVGTLLSALIAIACIAICKMGIFAA